MICNALSNQKTNRIQNWFCGIGCQQGGAAKIFMHAYNSHGANGSARLFNLMVSASTGASRVIISLFISKRYSASIHTVTSTRRRRVTISCLTL